MICSILIENLVETGWKLKKSKHIGAFAYSMWSSPYSLETDLRFARHKIRGTKSENYSAKALMKVWIVILKME